MLCLRTFGNSVFKQVIGQIYIFIAILTNHMLENKLCHVWELLVFHFSIFTFIFGILIIIISQLSVKQVKLTFNPLQSWKQKGCHEKWKTLLHQLKKVYIRQYLTLSPLAVNFEDRWWPLQQFGSRWSPTKCGASSEIQIVWHSDYIQSGLVITTLVTTEFSLTDTKLVGTNVHNVIWFRYNRKFGFRHRHKKNGHQMTFSLYDSDMLNLDQVAKFPSAIFRLCLHCITCEVGPLYIERSVKTVCINFINRRECDVCICYCCGFHMFHLVRKQIRYNITRGIFPAVIFFQSDFFCVN